MTDRQQILILVKRKVLEIEPKAQIILFGSRARNEEKDYSDWDFLVITNKVVDKILYKSFN